jgi:hypothetical protein
MEPRRPEHAVLSDGAGTSAGTSRSSSRTGRPCGRTVVRRDRIREQEHRALRHRHGGARSRAHGRAVRAVGAHSLRRLRRRRRRSRGTPYRPWLTLRGTWLAAALARRSPSPYDCAAAPAGPCPEPLPPSPPFRARAFGVRRLRGINPMIRRTRSFCCLPGLITPHPHEADER